jgi:hypothetical protein
LKEKAWQKTMSGEDQGDERKKTGVLAGLQDNLRGNLFTAWAASGIKMA